MKEVAMPTPENGALIETEAVKIDLETPETAEKLEPKPKLLLTPFLRTPM